ncbi:MAG: phytanoyl-CoA dioxygenase family protein [Acetobacteraceae bacterium]|nr:phytanoyl-CoA dioxygenase family protein [Acetobacteraceae bacterium]
MRGDLPTLSERDRFDATGYLRRYPHVQHAIAAGTVATAWQHYDTIGRAEGLKPNDLDPDFYRRTYLQREAAVTPDQCAAHYAAYGRARGYLPHPHAPRSATTGGLWTDAPDAPDRISNMEATATLTDRQAAMLRSWRQDGFLRLDREAPRDRWEPAALDIERLFAGGLPDLPFCCPALSPQPVRWQPEIAPHPAAALDVHMVSAPVRALILGDPLAEFLPLLFEDRALLATGRGVLRPPVGPPRRASVLFGCGVPRRFVSVWIALEDATALTVWPGSHRLPPIRVAGQFPNLPEALRLGLKTPAEALAAYDAALAAPLRDAGIQPTPLHLKPGGVVLLHPDLVHAATTLPPLATARSVSAQLCPVPLLPVHAERRPTRLHPHGADWFAAQFCPDMEPAS